MIRMVDAYLTIFNMELEVMFAPILRSTNEADIIEQSRTVEKMRFWCEAVLQNTLVLCPSDSQSFESSTLMENNTMFIPSELNESFMIQVLHSKISRILGEDFVLGSVKMKLSDSTMSYTYCDPDYTLPKTAEYFDAKHAGVHTSPWWERNDGYTYDFGIPAIDMDDEDVTLLFADASDPFEYFNEAFPSGAEIAASKNNSTGSSEATVIRNSEWKPKTV